MGGYLSQEKSQKVNNYYLIKYFSNYFCGKLRFDFKTLLRVRRGLVIKPHVITLKLSMERFTNEHIKTFSIQINNGFHQLTNNQSNNYFIEHFL